MPLAMKSYFTLHIYEHIGFWIYVHRPAFQLAPKAAKVFHKLTNESVFS